MFNICSLEAHELGSFRSNSTVEITTPRYGLPPSWGCTPIYLRSKTSPGLIVALSVTSAIAFCLIIVLIWLFLRRPRGPKHTNLTEEKQVRPAENTIIPYTLPQAIPQGASKFAMIPSLPQGSSSAQGTITSISLTESSYQAAIGGGLIQTLSSSSSDPMVYSLFFSFFHRLIYVPIFSLHINFTTPNLDPLSSVWGTSTKLRNHKVHRLPQVVTRFTSLNGLVECFCTSRYHGQHGSSLGLGSPTTGVFA